MSLKHYLCVAINRILVIHNLALIIAFVFKALLSAKRYSMKAGHAYKKHMKSLKFDMLNSCVINISHNCLIIDNSLIVCVGT